MMNQSEPAFPIAPIMEQMVTSFLNSLSENFVVSIITAIAALMLSSKFVSRPHHKKLPPLSNSGMIETIRILTRGKCVPDFYLSTMKIKGLVYRLPIPEMSPWIVVCDPALARKILIEEVEKPALYRRFSGLISSSDSIFSASTHSHSWRSARQGMAPSFSVANTCLSLPKMYEKIDDLQNLLAQFESEKTIIDLPELMTQLAMDFICAGKSSNFLHNVLCYQQTALSLIRMVSVYSAMFGIDHQTMQSSTSPGRLIMGEFNIILREYGRNQVYNPFRSLMFWNEEVRRGKVAIAAVEKSQQDFLNKYRAEKSPDEIAQDRSILGHLVRSPYASDKERCVDMTTLMIAGHDTTSYTLAWIFLEISRHPGVLTKLKKEIDSVVGEEEERISQRHLNSMVYLDQVIKEGMRLWPVSGLVILRQNSKEIEYGDFVLPKGSILQLCAFAISRVGIEVQSFCCPYTSILDISIYCSQIM